jgi:hypothetical protein
MKIIALVLTLIAVSGCGTAAPCGSSLVTGSWTGQVAGNADTLAFSGACGVTSSYCQAGGTVPNIVASTGTAAIVITSSNGNTGCLPTGTTYCDFAVDSDSLSFNCGGSTLTYSK